MFYAEERTDGLLRGSRLQRIQQIREPRDEPWSMDAILELHCGLLDHAHDVREAAMGALMELAMKRPEPVALTPVGLLVRFAHAFTVASGVDTEVAKCLADLHTPEADGALCNLLESGAGSNEQFQRWLTVLKTAHREEVLRQVSSDTLSSTRKKMLKQALQP